MPTEVIQVGKVSFTITENQQMYDNYILSHTFKIGGTYDDCISISYSYNRDNTPISAKIIFVHYDPECSLGNDLEKGGGTTLMLKAFLNYVHKKVPSIHIFTFEDMSHIDCKEIDLSKPPPRSSSQPLNLAYLSIAYNSSTWYEKYFDAKMSNPIVYEKYRHALQFLTDSNAKVDFIEFLQIAKPPSEQIELLKELYTNADTYRAFFQAIPFHKRCELLQSWLTTFIEYYLKKVYSPYNWEINIQSPKMKQEGGRKRIRGTRKQTQKLFPESNYRIIMKRTIHSL